MTIEELQNLPPDAYEKLEKMTDEELKVYLKDIEILEPLPVEASQICGGSSEDEEDEKPKIKKLKKSKDNTVDKLQGDISEDNPISPKKKYAKKASGLLDEIDQMIKDMGIEG